MGKPKVRFKGYTDDWEQRKLGELASSFEYGLNAAAKEYDGENKYIRIPDIDDITHKFIMENVTSPDMDLADAENYKLAEGDILFARTGASVGKSYIYRSSDGLVYYAGFLIRARIKEEYDAEFVFQNTLTDKYNRYIVVFSQRSGQPGVNAQEYSKFEIQVPKKKEQAKIGDYFCKLDHLITLHQRKCENAQKLKKYMLQKMFPKNGTNVPEIRFEGFKDAWEQRKLGDLYFERNEKGNDTLQILSVSIHSGVSSEELDANDLGKTVRRSKDKTTYKHVYKGDLIFNMMRAWQGAIGVAQNEGMISPAYISAVPNNELYPPFMNYLLRRRDIIEQINNLSYGVTDFRKRLYWDSFVKIVCQIPELEEQKCITECFQELDHLITLHQHKCEELKNIKKFMLQNMFVQEK